MKLAAIIAPLLAAGLLVGGCGGGSSSPSSDAVASGLIEGAKLNVAATCGESSSGTYDCILGPSLLRATVTCDTKRCVYAFTIPARAGDHPCGVYTRSNCASPARDVSGSFSTP